MTLTKKQLHALHHVSVRECQPRVRAARSPRFRLPHSCPPRRHPARARRQDIGVEVSSQLPRDKHGCFLPAEHQFKVHHKLSKLSKEELASLHAAQASEHARDEKGRFIKDSEAVAAREARALTADELAELRADIGRAVAARLVIAADGSISEQSINIDPAHLDAGHRLSKLTPAELHQLHHDVGVRVSHELERDAAGHFLPVGGA